MNKIIEKIMMRGTLSWVPSKEGKMEEIFNTIIQEIYKVEQQTGERPTDAIVGEGIYRRMQNWARYTYGYSSVELEQTHIFGLKITIDYENPTMIKIGTLKKVQIPGIIQTPGRVKKFPCKHRYNGICQEPTSKWQGDQVTKEKCGKCNLYKER